MCIYVFEYPNLNIDAKKRKKVLSCVPLISISLPENKIENKKVLSYICIYFVQKKVLKKKPTKH